MEEAELPIQFVFRRHGNVQHAGSGRKTNHGLRHHLYLVLTDVDLGDAVAFAVGA